MNLMNLREDFILQQFYKDNRAFSESYHHPGSGCNSAIDDLVLRLGTNHVKDLRFANET